MLTKFAELTVLSALLRFRRLTRLTRLTIATSRLTGGVGGRQKFAGPRPADPLSRADFFPQPKLLILFKRNQINQTLGFKGVARSQADEIADLFSAARGGGGSKVWRVESGDRRRRFVRKIVKLNTKSPPRGRVKSLDLFDRDRPARNSHLFAKLRNLFLCPAVAVGARNFVAKFRVGGG